MVQVVNVAVAVYVILAGDVVVLVGLTTPVLLDNTFPAPALHVQL